MKTEPTSSPQSNQTNVRLIGFSVVLVTTQNDPSIFNPDFLRQNNIIDADLQVAEPPVSTPVFSQAIFEGGLAVKADPNRIIFEQSIDPLPLDETNVRCPEMAKRFVELFPRSPYRAVGINPKGVRILPNEPHTQKLSDALQDKGAWLSFKDIEPDILLKAVYRYTKRTIILDVDEARMYSGDSPAPPTSTGLRFQANIHRDLLASDETGRIEELSLILSSWKEDLSDFITLVGKFDLSRFVS